MNLHPPVRQIVDWSDAFSFGFVILDVTYKSDDFSEREGGASWQKKDYYIGSYLFVSLS